MNTRPRGTVIIPVYNHGNQVRQVVERVLQLGLRLIVVDDGSTDHTPQVLASFSGLTIVRHKENKGKGRALLTGFAAALPTADWAITLDADGQHNPEDISSLIRALPDKQRPILIGKRTGMERSRVPWTSRWGRRFSNFWVWAACGRWFSDSQSGFRVYPLPETLDLGAKASRFQFEVEILVLAAWRGIPVIEVPVPALYEPGERVSHFKPWLDFWRNTRTFARLVATRFFIPLRLRK